MKRLYDALGYSWAGLCAAWRDEAAFRQELCLLILAVPVAFWLAPDRQALLLMIGSVVLVVIVELLNTGIEAAIDRHGPQQHPQAKKAKDCGSAAVLVALILAMVVWAILLC